MSSGLGFQRVLEQRHVQSSSYLTDQKPQRQCKVPAYCRGHENTSKHMQRDHHAPSRAPPPYRSILLLQYFKDYEDEGEAAKCARMETKVFVLSGFVGLVLFSWLILRHSLAM